MRIAILLSGFLRTILHNFKKNGPLFSKYNVDYFVHISSNESIDEYNNYKIAPMQIIYELKPVQVIIENEFKDVSKEFSNIRQMWYKFNVLNEMKNMYEKNNNIKYDLVIRLRPDVYIIDNKIDLIFQNVNDTIYGINDEFFYGNTQSMNKVAKIYENFDFILNNCKLNNRNKKGDPFFEFIETENINLINHDISFKLILTLCNIIALSGNSGAGKTKLMERLSELFRDEPLKLEGDRYHKWERGDSNWDNYTHLNPDANHISKFKDDVFNLKVGKNIYQVDYDHANGKFTEIKKIENKNNIILCGLHTLFDKDINNLYNLKIFLDTDLKLQHYWKIKRDVSERNYTVEQVMGNIEKRIHDSKNYIEPQLKESDLIIRFFTEENFEYKNISNEPKIYLKISIKKKFNLIKFIELLNNNGIEYNYVIDDYSNITFYKIHDEFYNIYTKLIHINGNKIKKEIIDYYTIINSLVIYLSMFKNNLLQ